jgi:pimeloyl-ACP methyl ester carboxylesterase
MTFAQTRSGALHYQVCDIVPAWMPRPETILFHHGVAASLDIWAGWLPVLASRYRLVRFDMRGYGQSAPPTADTDWSFDLLVEDLLHVADAAGAERFHLVGESIGGTAALACALKTPERLLSITLSNAAARGGLIGNVAGWRELVATRGQAGWARQMMEWRFHADAIAPDVAGWYLRLHESCDMQASLGLADLLLRTDLTPRLSEIGMPALLLSPDASPFIPLEVMVAMRSRIPAAELQVFAHARHGLPLSHGARCARVLRDFLQRRCAEG